MLRHLAEGAILGLGLGLGAAGTLLWRGSNGAKPENAATMTRPPPATGTTVREAQLNVVTLSDEARASLAIQVEPARTETLRRARVYGGVLVLPPGQSIVVQAPVAGTLAWGPTGPLRAGEAVEAGKTLFSLSPTYSIEGRTALAVSGTEATGQVRNARTQVEVAKVALERAERSVKGEAGSRRAVEEAQGQVRIAESQLESAVAREALLTAALQDVAAGRVPTIPIPAPITGVVRVITATGGQLVPAGSALVEITDSRRLWIRVAVPTSDLAAIDPDADAILTDPSARTRTALRALRVAAPPSATSATGTVDIYYELPAGSASRSPGERLSISLMLAGEETSLTVPWSALVYDVHGNTWLYVEKGPTAYGRQRAILRRVQGGRAVLDSGPPPGTPIVCAGAAELFGFETGFAK